MAVLITPDGLQHIGHHGGVLEIPPLPVSTILLVEVGSTAHGTGLPGGEDHDEMGVVIESPHEVLGVGERGFATVMQRTQPEGVRSGPGDTDRTLHSLRRFIRLAAGGNPSILMSFWAPVIHTTDQGEELRTLGEAFVGRHVVPRYRGYMQSQAMRLLGTRGGGHGRRGGGQREELIAEHGYDTKYAMHCARTGYARSGAATSPSTSGGRGASTSTRSSRRSPLTRPSRPSQTGAVSSSGRSTLI